MSPSKWIYIYKFENHRAYSCDLVCVLCSFVWFCGLHIADRISKDCWLFTLWKFGFQKVSEKIEIQCKFVAHTHLSTLSTKKYPFSRYTTHTLEKRKSSKIIFISFFFFFFRFFFFLMFVSPCAVGLFPIVT